MIEKKTDLLLSLLYAGEDLKAKNQKSTPIVGITRLEKLIFLLKHQEHFLVNAPGSQTYEFIPFHMGPWTNEVYDEIDFLESLNLIKKKPKGKKSPEDIAHDDELFNSTILDKYEKEVNYSDDRTDQFSLTEFGIKKARDIWNRLTEEERNRIIALKKKFNMMNLKQLLKYVYKKYPEYTTKSQIKDILGIE